MRITDDIIMYADCHPDKIALTSKANKRTFGQLVKNALLIATKLANLSKKRRRRSDNRPLSLGLLLNNRCEFVELFLAASIAGCTAVILDKKWPRKQIEDIVEWYQIDVLVVDDPKDLEDIILKNSIKIDLTNNCKQLYCEEVDLDLIHSVIDNPDLFIGFTSGTTSFPKAFMRTHQTWLESFIASSQEFKISAAEHILAPGALCHGLTLYSVLEGLKLGASIFLLDNFEMPAMVYFLRNENISTLILVPTMLKKITKTLLNKESFSAVKKIITSGSKLESSMLHEIRVIFPNAKLYEYYGASELGFVTVHDVFSPQPADSVGRPFYGVEVEFRDDNDRPVGVGEIGTLWVRSKFVIHCYYSGGDGVGFHLKNGWATVEDQGYRDSQGYIYIISRRNQVIISGGLNIYPVEVESALYSLSEISECCVFGLPDSYWGHIVCVAVSWNEGKNLSRKELLTRLSKKISKFKLPKKIFIVHSFLKTSSGKIAVNEMRNWLVEGNCLELE